MESLFATPKAQPNQAVEESSSAEALLPTPNAQPNQAVKALASAFGNLTRTQRTTNKRVHRLRSRVDTALGNQRTTNKRVQRLAANVAKAAGKQHTMDEHVHNIDARVRRLDSDVQHLDSDVQNLLYPLAHEEAVLLLPHATQKQCLKLCRAYFTLCQRVPDAYSKSDLTFNADEWGKATLNQRDVQAVLRQAKNATTQEEVIDAIHNIIIVVCNPYTKLTNTKLKV